jgi:hypothetical protein
VRPPSGAEALDIEGGPTASLRPRVFAVEARALPLPSSDSLTIAAETEVSLLMTPGNEELLDLRAPRGTMLVGMRFVIRSAASPRARLFLVRVLGVTELRGMHFDLVNARLGQPIDEASSSSRTTAEEPPAQEPSEFALRACANTIEVGGLQSIGTHVSVTLLAPVRAGERLVLSAPRDEIPNGVFLALRYFEPTGARRGVMRVEAVRSRPGMHDEVEGVLICPPARAPERQSYRAPFDDVFTVELRGRGGGTSIARMVDLSADGIGFRASAGLAADDHVRITRHDGELGGADLVIVRCDARDRQRYGARFAEANRGAKTLRRRLDLDEPEHMRRQHAQIEESRRALEASAGPLSASDARNVPNGRMGTRPRRG